MAMLIATGNLAQGCLAGRTAIVTGGGRGIGFEAARSLLWLGACVAIAEIDGAAASAAAATLVAEWGVERVRAIPTDISDATAVERLVDATRAACGGVDIVLNNATAAPTGSAVWETPISDWDRSYAVDLRGPALLARACLPAMIERRSGVFVCVSSAGGPYQAAYESMKAAQVALSTALDAELARTGVVAFTIGPGLVPTDTAVAAVTRLLPRLGMSGSEFRSLVGQVILSPEAAGAGFAAAIAMADRYAGQEISSSQALVDAGIPLPEEPVAFPLLTDQPPAPAAAPVALSVGPAELAVRCGRVRTTLVEQAEGWRHRSFFERQWIVRDFKQRSGLPVEGWLELLRRLEEALSEGEVRPLDEQRAQLGRLAAFYEHLGDLARGYVRDPAQREEQLQTVAGWRNEVMELIAGQEG